MASYDDIINGTFNSLNPGVAEMYAGIYPPASSAQPSYQSGMLGRGQPSTSAGSPYMTAAEQAQLNQQVAASKNLQLPWSATPSTASMYAGIYPNTPADPTNPATWGAFEQAYSDASNKPGTWMAQSRMQAQALMRQMAQRQAAGGAASVPHRGPSLLDLIGGGGVGRGSLATGGLMGLLQGGSMTTRVPGPTPAQAAARAANFGGGREVINSNGNYVTSNGEWHYSDPAHSGFTPISNNQSLS